MILVDPYQMSLFENESWINKFPKTQYLGSKEHLVKWIFNHAPNNIKTFLDAFSGTSVVSYYFKSKNKQVITNDFLKFNYHIGKSLIENKNIKLEAKDLELLLSENKNSETFIEDVFSGIFFERDQARFLDNFRANVNLLDNDYKISLALAIMNRALTRKVLLGHFAHLSALRYSNDPNRVKRNPTIARPLRDLFLELVPEYNKAIFDNGHENTAFCEDAIALIPKLDNIDLVYFDPPYYGCHPDYQSFYHFLETFVEYWKNKTFINGTKQYYPKKDSGFVKKEEIINSFTKLFNVSKRIPYWLISYNSKSYPDKDEMIKLIKEYKHVNLFEYEYLNHYGGKGSKKGTKEYLFYCYE
ncbi:MAG TPA: DNA adenine methylase [bacterium]|nr:DNA adenine methylase [bacterium]